MNTPLKTKPSFQEYFCDPPLPPSFYHPSPQKHLTAEERKLMLKSGCVPQNESDENQPFSPETELYLRKTNTFSNQLLGKNADQSESPDKFEETWPSTEQQTSAVDPSDDAISALHGLHDKKVSATEDDRESSVSDYIHRFRYGTPMSREERRKISPAVSGTRQPPGWLTSTPEDDSTVDHSSSKSILPSDTSDYTPKLPPGLSKLRHPLFKPKSTLSDQRESSVDSSLSHTQLLMDRAQAILSSASVETPNVSSDGLGSTQSFSPLSSEEASNGFKPDSTRRPLTELSYQCNAQPDGGGGGDAMSGRGDPGSSTRPRNMLYPEDDILSRWRRSRKMEAARERVLHMGKQVDPVASVLPYVAPFYISEPPAPTPPATAPHPKPASVELTAAKQPTAVTQPTAATQSTAATQPSAAMQPSAATQPVEQPVNPSGPDTGPALKQGTTPPNYPNGTGTSAPSQNVPPVCAGQSAAYCDCYSCSCSNHLQRHHPSHWCGTPHKTGLVCGCPLESAGACVERSYGPSSFVHEVGNRVADQSCVSRSSNHAQRCPTHHSHVACDILPYPSSPQKAKTPWCCCQRDIPAESAPNPDDNTWRGASRVCRRLHTTGGSCHPESRSKRETNVSTEERRADNNDSEDTRKGHGDEATFTFGDMSSLDEDMSSLTTISGDDKSREDDTRGRDRLVGSTYVGVTSTPARPDVTPARRPDVKPIPPASSCLSKGTAEERPDAPYDSKEVTYPSPSEDRRQSSFQHASSNLDSAELQAQYEQLDDSSEEEYSDDVLLILRKKKDTLVSQLRQIEKQLADLAVYNH